MSLLSGFRTVRTTTKLAISAFFTLLTVVYMGYIYSQYLEIDTDFQNRNAELSDITTKINSVRASVQWVFFYENDLILDHYRESTDNTTFLFKEKINMVNQQVRLENAIASLDSLSNLLRSEQDLQLADGLQQSLNQRLANVEQRMKRNAAGIAPSFEELNPPLDQLVAEQRHSDAGIDSNSTLFSVEIKLRNLEQVRIKYSEQDHRDKVAAADANALHFLIGMGVVFVALCINAAIFNVGMLHPIEKLMSTIKKVRSGDDSARAAIKSGNELGQLGRVLDGLLDEKNNTLEQKEAEREALNASVITLIQNVFQLSQRDLTIRVPVAEDITGAVSDSINQLAESMATTLNDVISVSQRVDDASTQIRSQSEKVLHHTSTEQTEISQALQELDTVIQELQVISQLATVSHTTSKQAINTSENAMTSVSETIESISKIRQIIHEAEKRIKRLGERSQEIGGIVGLINNISERTHILSLNASMHAASAGEAGRGLTVVVDEVQRLAENSREATAEIETLVNNIQLETADMIQVMNAVISEVVTGTRLAEEAGERMDDTRAATNSLVESVVRIAKSAENQGKVAQQLHERATSIGQSTNVTNSEMRLQSQLSEQLVSAADKLQQSVNVFKLSNA